MMYASGLLEILSIITVIVLFTRIKVKERDNLLLISKVAIMYGETHG